MPAVAVYEQEATAAYKIQFPIYYITYRSRQTPLQRRI